MLSVYRNYIKLIRIWGVKHNRVNLFNLVNKSVAKNEFDNIKDLIIENLYLLDAKLKLKEEK